MSKLNASGTALIYSSYFAASISGIAVDASGNAYLTGAAGSSGFPITPGAAQTSLPYAGGGGAFVTKLNPAGNTLIYSTYSGGGSSHYQAYSIAVDGSGNALITGLIDYGSGFVTKVNASGSAFIYSKTFNMVAYGIAVDGSGNAYVTGASQPNFVTTPGAYQTTPKGDLSEGAFLMELNTTGSVVYSTFLGGSACGPNDCWVDIGRGIAVDASGSAYVTGYAKTSYFPTTPGAFQTGTVGGTSAFVTKINPSGSALVYSTLLRGDPNVTFRISSWGEGIALDASGNAYITGATNSTAFPVVDAVQSTYHGGSGDLGNCSYSSTTECGDAFVTELNATGTRLIYSTYLGGNSDDIGYGIAVDSFGNTYVTGQTGSTNFPTVNAFQSSNGGSTDAFVAKIGSPLPTAFMLTVMKNGAGSGLLTSTPAGINCGQSCSASFDSGTQVMLSVSTGSGSSFGGWSGDCDATGKVTMDTAKSCTATFNLNGPPTASANLAVSVAVTLGPLIVGND